MTMIDQCPICGGRIQSTSETYYDYLYLSDDATEVVGEGRDCGVDGERRVYCENDHTQNEMTQYLAKAVLKWGRGAFDNFRVVPPASASGQSSRWHGVNDMNADYRYIVSYADGTAIPNVFGDAGQTCATKQEAELLAEEHRQCGSDVMVLRVTREADNLQRELDGLA